MRSPAAEPTMAAVTASIAAVGNIGRRQAPDLAHGGGALFLRGDAHATLDEP